MFSLATSGLASCILAEPGHYGVSLFTECNCPSALAWSNSAQNFRPLHPPAALLRTGALCKSKSGRASCIQQLCHPTASHAANVTNRLSNRGMQPAQCSSGSSGPSAMEMSSSRCGHRQARRARRHSMRSSSANKPSDPHREFRATANAPK